MAFGSTSSAATLAVGESKVVIFEGTYLRTSGILGQITADDQPQEAVTVSLQGRGENRSMTTNSAGQYSFDELRSGDYAIGISGYSADEMSFDVTSKTVTVAYGETANIPFEGILLRTAGIMGTVTVEGVGPIADVLVTIQGQGENKSMATNSAGEYSFDRLHAGDYSVTISGFDDDEYGFDATTATVTVALRETETVAFDGIMLRTAGISGEVTVGDDDAPLSGVTVTVSGGPRDEEHSATTDSDGMYLVENLHAGDYSVVISGYDTREYGFDPTTETVSVGLRETLEVAFQGTLLRTAGVSGRVSVDNVGMAGVMVMLTGEEDREMDTNADGQFGFTGLAAGDYTLTISGYDAAEYAFEPTRDLTLALDESSIQNFTGRSLRTAGVMGYVTVEDEGLPGISVTLIKVVSQTSGEIVGVMPTGADGGYAFADLLAGVYRVDIAEYDDEHDFADGTTWTGPVATDETAMANFAATIIRTASVSGMVTVDGEAMADAEVTLSGGADDSMMTGDDGMYSFGGLRKGDYTVTLTNPDGDMYDFPTVAQSVNLSVGQAQSGVSFAGARLRQASISGQVAVEGTPVPDVMVMLSGDESDEEMTDANGEYNFPGLAGGSYMVTITNPDTAAYEFAVTEAEIALAEDAAHIQDFMGMHTRTASVSGYLYLDEGPTDEMYNEGEPKLPGGGVPLLLQGPGIADVIPGMSDSTGAYSFGGLQAGSYRVLVAMNETVGAALTAAGYRFAGAQTGQAVDVAAAGNAMVNFPFRITTQTINVGAVMGKGAITGDPVGAVKLALFPTAEDANDDTNMLGSATTDTTGVAKFDFARAMDLGPGGQGLDHLVFVKVTGTGHRNVVVSDNPIIEIEYESTDRVSAATTAVRLLSLGVNFRWSVKSDADAKDGNEFLPHWKVVMGTDTIATNAKGLAGYSGTLESTADLPATFTVKLDTIQVDTLTHQGEKWVQSAKLTFVHNGMTHPAKDTANDLGPIYVTFTTQTLVLGVYREADDRPGFSDYRSGLPRGDHRPHPSVAREMSVELLVRDSRNRLRRFEWDHDDNPRTDDKEAMGPVRGDGMFRMARLPAGVELTARFRVGALRTLVTDYADIETFGDDLNEGSSLGAFGDMSGGVPQVRVCPVSEGTDDDECATYGYQWMTGGVIGNVGGNSGHRVDLEMTTDAHGAADDDTRTRTDGIYGFGTLRDGEYDVTASPTRDYQIVGNATQDVALYHDEYVDDKDTTTKYVGTAARDTARWRTRQVGLAIMGYVGNDVDFNNLFRGDEAIAGVTLQLMTGVLRSFSTGRYFGGKVVATTTTNARGFYAFDDLAAGTYQVRTVSGNTYWVVRSFSRNFNYSGPVGADEYPTPGSGNFVEGEFDLPYWNPDREVAEYVNTLVVDDKGTDDRDDDIVAFLRNFALVWSDGGISGKVDNISGSSGGIDIRIYQCRDVATAADDCGRANPVGYSGPIELTTTASGGFQRGGLTEGTYQIEIEDVGWTPPLLGRNGRPDDDADATVDADDDGVPDAQAPTMFERYLEGREDHASTGTFYVYDGNVSDDDNLGTTIALRGYMHGDGGATYGDSTGNVPLGLDRADDSEETDNLGSPLMIISFASETVRFAGTSRFISPIPLGADLEADITYGECIGFTCEVGFYPTGTPLVTGNLRDTLSLTMTAANGYDDHVYRVAAERQNPMDHSLLVASITVTGGTIASGDEGSQTDPYVITTTSPFASGVTVHFNLGQYGIRDARNQYCAQSLVVEEANEEEVDARADDADDVCENERYRLGVASGAYQLHVSSEDDRTRVYYLVVQRP